jgi:tetratricopeptide (TPR) repeat protein
MTLTFSLQKCSDLLEKYQLNLIKTEDDNEQALAAVEELMHLKNRTPEEDVLYGLLIVLIEKFEEDFYHPGSASTPNSMLLFLMEQQNVKPEDLVEVVGSEDVVLELVNGEGEISDELAETLGDFFKVDSSLFRSELLELPGISETFTSVNSPYSDYQQLLTEVLQATHKSDGNSEVVYPLLAGNPEKLDDNFIAALQAWEKATLPKVEASQAEDIAGVISEFGNLIQQFPLANKATNMEIGLACYEISLTVFPRHSHPEIWAAVQNRLGIAYSDRIKGDTAENLELAIAAYQNALEVYTKEVFPTHWAVIQNNLGTAYNDRISGDRAENLELAIAAYKDALQVRTKEEFPIDWAGTQNNLGTAYNYRISGDRAENLEKAIAACEKALQVRTKEKFPIDWAGTQNNLGANYSDRISGDRAENLELAIAAYENALQVRTKEEFPIDWAGTQNNLGKAYNNRISGDKAENLELAIAAYQKALEVYTKDGFPNRWATTQNNLGAAYSDRIKGDRAENLELAIAAFQKALEVYTKDAFPTDWATTQNNFELTIAAYQNALEVRTKEAFPTDWATTQNNFGTADSKRIKGDTKIIQMPFVPSLWKQSKLYDNVQKYSIAV